MLLSILAFLEPIVLQWQPDKGRQHDRGADSCLRIYFKFLCVVLPLDDHGKQTEDERLIRVITKQQQNQHSAHSLHKLLLNVSLWTKHLAIYNSFN